jgi:DegV family protein with EDD domain
MEAAMEMTSNQIYNSVVNGAYRVIQNRETLNKINVFPVQDGDTGSNLASMMRAIIHNAEEKETVRETLASIADAALYGARGNSGIIFAQYFTGLSESIAGGESISIEAYADASHKAVDYAYGAVDQPVEGTIITVMNSWGAALVDESTNSNNLVEVFTKAFQTILNALEKTKDQLPVLKKANVVDSGAKGFTYFIEGVLYYIETGEVPVLEEDLLETSGTVLDLHGMEHEEVEGFRYCTECLLQGSDIDSEILKKDIACMGDSLVVAGNKSKTRIHVHTDTPAKLFDYIYSKGTIVFQKVDDMYKQASIVNERKFPIAVITDSIADIPKEVCDNQQIHIIHLDLLYEDRIYMDKLTIEPKRILEISKESHQLPTSSQPNRKQLENQLDYLSTYYDEIIVLSVSSALSGTYNSFMKASEKFKDRDFRITVIDTKQNSGAQGLIVGKCADYIKKGYDYDKVIDLVKKDVANSKILVQVKHLDSMIKSGRLSVKAGKIAKAVGLKPIVTLDDKGEGGLESIAFSSRGSQNKLISHIKTIQKKRSIEQYNIVHVNNIREAELLAETMTAIIGFPPIYITETSSLVAVGAGEGAVALSYLLNREV